MKYEFSEFSEFIAKWVSFCASVCFLLLLSLGFMIRKEVFLQKIRVEEKGFQNQFQIQFHCFWSTNWQKLSIGTITSPSWFLWPICSIWLMIISISSACNFSPKFPKIFRIVELDTWPVLAVSNILKAEESSWCACELPLDCWLCTILLNSCGETVFSLFLRSSACEGVSPTARSISPSRFPSTEPDPSGSKNSKILFISSAVFDMMGKTG